MYWLFGILQHFLSFLYVSTVCTQVCVSTHIYAHMEIRGQCWVSFFLTLHLIFFSWDSVFCDGDHHFGGVFSTPPGFSCEFRESELRSKHSSHREISPGLLIVILEIGRLLFLTLFEVWDKDASKLIIAEKECGSLCHWRILVLFSMYNSHVRDTRKT